MTGAPAVANPEAKVARIGCEGVTVRFGGLVALHDVGLRVEPGEIVGLVGPNGAGKSTLFAVLSGLLHPARGRVWLDGADVTSAGPQARAHRGLARTFQHPEIFVGLSVRDHLVLACRARHARRRVWSDLVALGSLRAPEPAETDTVDGLIDLLGLGPVAARPAHGLPLGLARLVELGRALASSPDVVLLDEPSSGLDSSETEQFEATLVRIAAERGVSVLIVEHDVDLVMRMCSRVYVLDFGVLIAEGTPSEVRADPKVRAAYLGEEPTEAEPADRDRAGIHDGGRDAGPGAAHLVVQDLSVRYGDAVALSGVSFTLGAGRALAVLGPNGAGKSSLARALSGLVPPASGRVTAGGTSIESLAAYQARRLGILHLPEGRGVFRNLSVLDNLRMAASTIEGRRDRKACVERAMELFPILGERRSLLGGQLSGGEQQMLSLARALVVEPRLLIADELSLGLAPRLVDVVFQGLERARAQGVTIVIIEQYVHRVLAFADECLVLQRGAAVWHGPASEAKSDLLRHYLGEAMTEVS